MSTEEPLLGLATTWELIEELSARAEIAKTNGETWPDERTVDSKSNSSQLLEALERIVECDPCECTPVAIINNARQAIANAKGRILVCPSCRGREVRRLDEERASCNSCGWITDIFEAQKAAMDGRNLVPKKP